MTDNRVTIDDTERRKIRALAFREAADTLRSTVYVSTGFASNAVGDCIRACELLAKEAEREAVVILHYSPDELEHIRAGQSWTRLYKMPKDLEVGSVVELRRSDRASEAGEIFRRVTHIKRVCVRDCWFLSLEPIEDDHD